jgi:hypothetical protein
MSNIIKFFYVIKMVNLLNGQMAQQNLSNGLNNNNNNNNNNCD